MLTYKVANKVLDALGGFESIFSGTIYLGLSKTAPSRNGTGYTEPPANAGYARTLIGATGQSLTNLMSKASPGGIKNNKTIYFPQATGNWGTCTHYLIMSAATGGDLLAYGTLTTSITPTAGTVPLVRAKELQMTLS